MKLTAPGATSGPSCHMTHRCPITGRYVRPHFEVARLERATLLERACRNISPVWAAAILILAAIYASVNGW